MLTVMLLLALLLAVQPAAPTTAPAAQDEVAPETTAESVLADFIEATGGADAQAKVQHRVHTGTISVEGAPIPINGTMTLIMDFSQNFRLTSTIAKLGTLERVATPTVGWTRDPLAGLQIMPDDERTHQLHDLTSEALSNPASLYETREYVGEATVEETGEPAHHLKLTLPTGRVVEQWFSVESGFLVRQLDKVPTPLGEAEEVTLFDDWTEVESADGSFAVKMPFTISKSTGPQTVKIELEEATVNSELPEDAFAIPEDVAEKAGLGK